MILLQGYVLLVLAYLFFPLLGAFLEGVSPLPTPKTGQRERSFAILIPAHNEERVLPKLLESIQAQRYERCEVFVVADNCTDHTFEIAREAGVRAFERKTEEPSTKSQALRFLFATADDLRKCDAVVILDADNLLKSGFLEAVDDEMAQGYRVVQGLRKPKNPFSSRSSTLDYLSEAVSHRVGSAGRRRLGLTGTISGSGIAYERALFERLLEETKDTLVEDCEWQLRLMLELIPVRFAPQAVILDEKTDNFHDLTVQRTRWISGKYRLIPRYLPLFLRSLLTRGRG
ncbi:MAG: glycosyltransferase family 2 protein, partial [Bacteroidota bacterium]